MGADQLQLAPLGTGSKTVALRQNDVMNMPAAELGVRGLSSLMDDASALERAVVAMDVVERDGAPDRQRDRRFERRHPRRRQAAADVPALQRTVRRGLAQDKLKLTLDGKQPASIAEMDRAENMDTLVQIGKAASVLIEDRHFGRGFDIE